MKTTALKIAEFKDIDGYKYGSADSTEKAYYYYVGVTKPKIDALTKTEKGMRGLKPEVVQARTKEFMKEFAISTGALNSENTEPPPRNVAPTKYTSNPSAAEIKELVRQGFNQIKVGENTFNIDPK